MHSKESSVLHHPLPVGMGFVGNANDTPTTEAKGRGIVTGGQDKAAPRMRTWRC